MPQFLVKTNGSLEYTLDAFRFEICSDILYFYDEEGEVIWVIKEWISFFRMPDDGNDPVPKNPDEFYDRINKENN